MTHGRQCRLDGAPSVADQSCCKRLYDNRSQTRLMSWQLMRELLEVGIEDFEVQQRWFCDGYSFRSYAQESTQRRYENP
jgi:hypothetical protein